MSWLSDLWSQSGKQLRRSAAFLVAAMVIGFGVEWLATSNARMLPAQGVGINDIALAPDGSFVAIAYSDGLVELRRTDTSRRLIRSFKNARAPVMDLHIDNPILAGERLIFARANGTMRVETAIEGTPLSDDLTFPNSFVTPQFEVAPTGAVWLQGIDLDGPWIGHLRPGETLAQHVGMGDNASPKLQLIGAMEERVHVLTPTQHLVWGTWDEETDTGLEVPLTIKERLPRGDNHVALQDGRLMKLENGVWRNVGGADDEVVETTSEPMQRTFGTQEEMVLNALQFSADGRSILTADQEGTVFLWNLDRGEHISWQAHDGVVATAVFSPDGTEILTAGEDGLAKIWSLMADLVTRIEGHEGWVNSAAFSPDGTKIVTSGTDGTLRYWNRDGTVWHPPMTSGRATSSATFSPDGTKILFGTDSGFVNVVTIGEDGAPTASDVAPMSGHTSLVFNIVFAPDGDTFLSTSTEDTIRIWNTEGESLGEISNTGTTTPSAIFLGDGSELATASTNGAIQIWGTDGTLRTEIGIHGERATAIAVSPDGNRIATAGTDATVRIWTQTAPGVWEQARFGHECTSISESAVLTGAENAQRWLWFHGDENRVCAIGLSGFSRSASLPEDTTTIAFPYSSGDVQVSSILIGRENGTVEHRDALGEQAFASYRGHNGPITQIETVSLPDRHRAAIAAMDGSVQVVDFPHQDATLFARALHMTSNLMTSADAVREGVLDEVMPPPLGSSDGLGYRPTDPLLDRQWNLKASDEIPGAAGFLDYWRATSNLGSPDTVVALIDTGIDDTHPSLVDANIRPGWDMVTDPDIGNDGDGRDRDPSDPGDACDDDSVSSYQGTALMSVLASPHDDFGIAGLAPGASYVPIRTLGKCGGQLSDVSDSIRWAAGTIPVLDEDESEVWNETPADIIALGIGLFRECPRSLQDAIDSVVDNGSVVVAIAGQQSVEASFYAPAGCDNVLTVASSDARGYLNTYSNFGDTVELMATAGANDRDDTGDGEPDAILVPRVGAVCPGDPSTIENQLCYFEENTGLAMALAHTVGGLALLKSQYPEETNQAIVDRLLNTATRPVGEAAIRASCEEVPSTIPSEEFPGECLRPVGGRILDMTALLDVK